MYYGKNAIDIPSHILFYDKPDRFKAIRGHWCNFPAALEKAMVEWLEDLTLSPGKVHGTPTNWKPTSSSSCQSPARKASATHQTHSTCSRVSHSKI